jgi:hypothetical protein
MTQRRGAVTQHYGKPVRYYQGADDEGEPPFDEVALAKAERYMKLHPAASWEECRAAGLGQDVSRYRHHPVENAGVATAPRPGMPTDPEFATYFPVTQSRPGYSVHGTHLTRTQNDSESTSGGPASFQDYPAPVGRTITQRLGLKLAQAEPWLRPAITDSDGSLWSCDQAALDAAIQYSDAKGIGLVEACRRLGLRAERVGHQRDYGRLPAHDLSTLTE